MERHWEELGKNEEQDIPDACMRLARVSQRIGQLSEVASRHYEQVYDRAPDISQDYPMLISLTPRFIPGQGEVAKEKIDKLRQSQEQIIQGCSKCIEITETDLEGNQVRQKYCLNSVLASQRLEIENSERASNN